MAPSAYTHRGLLLRSILTGLPLRLCGGFFRVGYPLPQRHIDNTKYLSKKQTECLVRFQHSPHTRLLNEPSSNEWKRLTLTTPVGRKRTQYPKQDPYRFGELQHVAGRRQATGAHPERGGDVFYIVSPCPSEPMARLRVVQCAYSGYIYKHRVGLAWES